VRNVRLSWSVAAIARIEGDNDVFRSHLCRPIAEFLSVLSSGRTLETPLRVEIPGVIAKYFALAVDERANRPETQTQNLIAYKILDFDIIGAKPKDLANVMSLQPVICLDEDIELTPHDDYETLLKQLRPCFNSEYRSKHPRRLFLSGVPTTVFPPEELEATLDTDADALLKLYNDIATNSQPTWEEFTSVIKLVKPGFWPSRDDLLAGHKSVQATVRDL